MAGRFDYVKYDEAATETQKLFKVAFEDVCGMVENRLGSGRPQSLAMTKLEEAYMWIGKAIRDQQIARGGAAKDTPERG